MGVRAKLTDKPMKYRWCYFGEYDFGDQDEIRKDWSGQLTKRETRLRMGLPRFTIDFWRVPNGRKNKVLITLKFNDARVYEGIDAPSTVRKNQLKEWENEALLWLAKEGVIEVE